MEDVLDPPLTAEELLAVDAYQAEWWETVRHLAAGRPLAGSDWKDWLPPPPIGLLQRAALHHPSGKVRREALTTLDHDANDESAEVFRRALADPSPRVRVVALHGLSCERCRAGELCTDDVVPTLVDLVGNDGNAKVRHAAIVPLLQLSGRDGRAVAAIERASVADPDPLVRRAAAAALAGDLRGFGSRKAMRRRDRHAADRTS